MRIIIGFCLISISIIFGLVDVSASDDDLEYQFDNWISFQAVQSTKTGDVVIVYSKDDEREGDRKSIYAIFIKYNGNDSFEINKPRLISAQDSESREKPTIVYNSESNSFFASWNSWKSAGNGYVSYIEGAVLNAKGRKKGKNIRFNRRSNNYDEGANVVSLAGKRGIGETNASFAIIFYDDLDKFHYLALLDNKGKLLQNFMPYFQSDLATKGYFHSPAESVMLGSDRNLYINSYALYKTKEGGWTTKSSVQKLSLNGTLIDTFIISEERSKYSILDMGQNKFLAAWSNESDVKMRKIKTKAKMKFFKAEITPFTEDQPSGKIERLSLVKTDADNIFLIALASNTFYTTEIQTDGKPKGDTIVRSSPNTLEFLAIPVRDSSKILLLSFGSVRAGSPEYLLKGDVIDPLQQ